MPRLQNFGQDPNVTLQDRLLGAGSEQGITYTYTLRSIFDRFQQEGITGPGISLFYRLVAADDAVEEDQGKFDSTAYVGNELDLTTANAQGVIIEVSTESDNVDVTEYFNIFRQNSIIAITGVTTGTPEFAVYETQTDVSITNGVATITLNRLGASDNAKFRIGTQLHLQIIAPAGSAGADGATGPQGDQGIGIVPNQVLDRSDNEDMSSTYTITLEDPSGNTSPQPLTFTVPLVGMVTNDNIDIQRSGTTDSGEIVNGQIRLDLQEFPNPDEVQVVNDADNPVSFKEYRNEATFDADTETKPENQVGIWDDAPESTEVITEAATARAALGTVEKPTGQTETVLITIDADGTEGTVTLSSVIAGMPQTFEDSRIVSFISQNYAVSGSDATFTLSVTVDLNDYTTSPTLTISDGTNNIPYTGNIASTDGSQTFTTATLTYSSLPQNFTATLVSDNSNGVSRTVTQNRNVNVPTTPDFSISRTITGFSNSAMSSLNNNRFEFYDGGDVDLVVNRTTPSGWTAGGETIDDISIAIPGTAAATESTTQTWSYAVSGVSDVSRTRSYTISPIRSFRFGSFTPSDGMTIAQDIAAQTNDENGLGDFSVWNNSPGRNFRLGTASPLGMITIDIQENAHLYFMYDASLADLNSITQMAGITIDYLASGTIAQRPNVHGYKVYTTDGLPFASGSITLNIT